MSDASPLEIALGHEVRAWRLRRDMTLQDLATKAGVSKATVERLENASTSTSVVNTWRIADALGVALSVLVERAEAMVAIDSEKTPWTAEQQRAFLRSMDADKAAQLMGWTVARLRTFLEGDDLSARRRAKSRSSFSSFDDADEAARDEDNEKPRMGDE